MTQDITKVKKQVKKKMRGDENKVGWMGVLADLRKLVLIVERKIERREPWPGQPTSQNSEQRHSV